MTEPYKINPQLSVVNEKNELKKQRENVETMKNRVQLLRQQLQKEKESVKKHKQLTKQTIQKKIQVNKINQWKTKDNSNELERIDSLRKRNHQIRMSHQKELQDIHKAIYLVKLDDAREVKVISDQHNKKIKQMQKNFLQMQRQKKRKVYQQSQAAKERYMKYWKQKLAGIYTQQAQTIVQVGKQKEESKKQIQQLQEEQIKLMEQITKYHSKSVQTKKQYLAALSLPVKEVAEAMVNSSRANQNASYMSKNRKSMTLNNSISQMNDKNPVSRYGQIPSSKMPNANVNQDKLKIILQQLKKVDRNAIHTSR